MLEGLKSWDPANVGPFKLLGVLGNGGFGRVYLGQGPDGQRVAVKVIKPDLAEDPEFRERFGREVSAARKVGGKFTARVVDADTDGEELWLATEYISGPTLREAVAVQGPLADSSVLALAVGLAEALAAIHRAGLVHRDLKPDNVLLAYDGPRVIDFGIARVAGASTLTGTGVLMGTLAYMSPEQAIGQTVGPPSDVFSLGSMIVFAATARGPYGDGSQAELLYRVASQAPSLDRVPPQVRALVEPCMAAEPERRPTTRDLVEHLGGTRPSVGWLRTETTAAQAPHDTAPMTAHLPQVGRPSGPTWPPSARGTELPARAWSGRRRRRVEAVGARPPASASPRWSARRIGAIALAAVVVVGLAVGIGVSQLGGHHTAASQSGGHQTAASWSGGHRIDTADGLSSVSCASADFCAAADSGGNAFYLLGWLVVRAAAAQQRRTVVGVLPDGRLLRGHQQRQCRVHVRGRQVVAADRAVRRQRQPRSPHVGLLRHRHLLHSDREHARLSVFRRHLGTRGPRREQRQADLGFMRVGDVLRCRRFRRECLHLRGQLVVRAPAAQQHRGCRGCRARRPASAWPASTATAVRVLRRRVVAVGSAD